LRHLGNYHGAAVVSDEAAEFIEGGSYVVRLHDAQETRRWYSSDAYWPRQSIGKPALEPI
jgi:hypothetical protein